jgi:hypothetical protein
LEEEFTYWADAGKVSYARTMDKGTPHNILTELKMSSDQYNLVTTMYYVCFLMYEGELC